MQCCLHNSAFSAQLPVALAPSCYVMSKYRHKCRKWTTAILAAALALVPAYVFARAQTASQDMKNAGRNTKQAAKDTGHATKKTTKKAAHATKKTAKKAARKTKNTAKGAKQGAQQPTGPQ